MANDPVRFELKEASYAKCLSFLKALYTYAPRVCAQELTAMAYTWEREVKRHMPVDTGLLRSSVAVIPAQYSVGTITAAVGTNTEYGIYIELGTDWERNGVQMGIAGGRVASWMPGQAPIMDWPAKDADLTGSPGSKRRANAMIPSQTEFMPPFRGSWPLIVGPAIDRLRRRLALVMQAAAK